MFKNIELFLYMNDIQIIYREYNPNDIYSNKYNIISDGEQIYKNKYIIVSDATVACNILKESKTVIVISKNIKKLTDKYIISKIYETFNLKYS